MVYNKYRRNMCREISPKEVFYDHKNAEDRQARGKKMQEGVCAQSKDNAQEGKSARQKGQSDRR